MEREKIRVESKALPTGADDERFVRKNRENARRNQKVSYSGWETAIIKFKENGGRSSRWELISVLKIKESEVEKSLIEISIAESKEGKLSQSIKYEGIGTDWGSWEDWIKY